MADSGTPRRATEILRQVLTGVVGLSDGEAERFLRTLADELSDGKPYSETTIRAVCETFVRQMPVPAPPGLAPRLRNALLTLGLGVVANLLTDELKALVAPGLEKAKSHGLLNDPSVIVETTTWVADAAYAKWVEMFRGIGVEPTTTFDHFLQLICVAFVAHRSMNPLVREMPEQSYPIRTVRFSVPATTQRQLLAWAAYERMSLGRLIECILLTFLERGYRGPLGGRRKQRRAQRGHHSART